MSGDDSSAAPSATRQARGRGLLWLLVFCVLALAAWQAWRTWRPTPAPAAAGIPSAGPSTTDPDAEPIGDPAQAIAALRRDQRQLAQRLSDLTSNQQVMRDEVLGVGERAALTEQAVARIGSSRAQGEAAPRLDEAELLLTIGQQQMELSGNRAAALHAYALADGVLAGLTDPSVVNLRQTLAQEVAAMQALPPDPRAALNRRLDAFETTLEAPAFAAAEPAPQRRPSVLDRVVGSLVEVHRASAQDLLDPATREAALTAARLELTMARLALERTDEPAFHAALQRIGGWLPRLFSGATLAQQRAMLASLQQARLSIDVPTLGGTLAQLRRLREQQLPPAPVATPPTPPANPAASRR